MEIGVLTTVYARESLEFALRHATDMGIHAFEIGTCGFFPKSHCNPTHLLSEASSLKAFRELLARYDARIVAFAAHGQPLHPDPAVSAAYREDLMATLRLASEMQVGKVTLLSGLPEGHPGDRAPNWTFYPFPPGNLKQLEWQWSERLLPYWQEMARAAKSFGVRFCIEMHTGELVYNPPTLLRLRSEIGDSIGASVDPSHLVWQGMDVCEVLSSLGEAVYHVHAKDSRTDRTNLQRIGVFDSTPWSVPAARTWLFRTVGFGQSEEWWRAFISRLRLIGYDDVLAIEHEDPLLDSEEGLEMAANFLRNLLPTRPANELWYE